MDKPDNSIFMYSDTILQYTQLIAIFTKHV